MILFGGTAYQGAAANGAVDDFQIWTKALTDDDVKAAMAGFPDGDVPADLIGLWSFEDEPDKDGNFFSAGSKKTIPAYHFSYEAVQDAGEGQNGRKIEQPIFVGGSPFLAGTAYPVRSVPTWSASHYLTAIEGQQGNDTQGSATVRLGEVGDHIITLTLNNIWGSDTRQYPVFTAADKEDGISDAGAGARIHSVGEQMLISFAESGSYKVSVCNAAGATVADEAAEMTAGGMMRVRLAAPGVYVVKISKEGKTLRTLKVMR
ncbi:MAG: hypothetical protein HUK04_06675 [Bacteroidaceae bacterium]|nr:hypothetical protein [Bacteroidaceae bacterium]